MPTGPERPATSARAARLEPLTRLATGGMAEIWLARELGAAGLERFVVVKRLLPHLAREPAVVDMFVSEARFIARLSHPNVVQIHELAQDEEGYYLVMEYVAGCTVRELMSAADRVRTPLPPEVAVCVIEQACRGAHAAHELADPSGRPLGVVHRDISPHNLMVGPDGDVKLLDFGIAKATADSEATQTRSLKGKCSYMSPEQCRAGRLDRRSDVFSLGVVFWELLAGERLFVRDSEFASMEAIVSGDIPLPSAVRPELPAALDEVVAKALAKKPEERWQSADDLRRALVAAGEAAGLRSSRDALAAKLEELLGERLAQRKQALLQSATRPAAELSTLHEALVGTDPAAQRGTASSSLSGRSRSGSDDEATVVQRRSQRPGEDTLAAALEPPPPSVGDGADRSFDPLPLAPETPGDPAADEATVVQSARPSGPRPSEPFSSQPCGTEPHPSEPRPSVPLPGEPFSSQPFGTEPRPSEPRPSAPRPSDRPSMRAAASPWPAAEPLPEPRSALRVGIALLSLALVALVAVLVYGWRRTEPERAQAQTSQEPTARASSSESLPPAGVPLRFVIAPTVKPDVIRSEMAPFAAWLGKALGRPLEVVIAASYDDCGSSVATGRADLGLLPPLIFVQTLAREPKIQPIAIRLYEGSRGSDGYLLVREDVPIAGATDLRGRTICLVDRESTTGYLLPRIWMRAAGVDPDKDVHIKLSGNHLAALRDLSESRCDAAAVYSGAFLSAPQQGIRVGTMRVLAVTGRVPQDVIVAAPGMPEAERARLQEKLIGFEPQRDIQSSRVGAVLGITGFARYEADEFTVIRDAAARENLLPRAGAGR